MGKRTDFSTKWNKRSEQIRNQTENVPKKQQPKANKKTKQTKTGQKPKLQITVYYSAQNHNKLPSTTLPKTIRNYRLIINMQSVHIFSDRVAHTLGRISEIPSWFSRQCRKSANAKRCVDKDNSTIFFSKAIVIVILEWRNSAKKFTPGGVSSYHPGVIR